MDKSKVISEGFPWGLTFSDIYDVVSDVKDDFFPRTLWRGKSQRVFFKNPVLSTSTVDVFTPLLKGNKLHFRQITLNPKHEANDENKIINSVNWVEDWQWSPVSNIIRNLRQIDTDIVKEIKEKMPVDNIAYIPFIFDKGIITEIVGDMNIGTFCNIDVGEKYLIERKVNKRATEELCSFDIVPGQCVSC